MDWDARWRDRFPRLFTPTYVAYADADGVFTTEQFAEELVSRLHLVAVTGAGRVVVAESDLGWRFLPGGRREAGETLIDLGRRELMEEAGAELTGPLTVFGGFEATSRRAEPYRPHLPHPRAFWAFAAASVRLVAAPTSPEDGEQIVAVHDLPPDDAVAFVREHDEYDADVLALAIAMGLVDGVRA